MNDIQTTPIPLINHILGGKIFKNLSPQRKNEIIEVMGKEPIDFIASLFDNLDSIDDECNKLKINKSISDPVWNYINEAIRSYLCGQYIAACIFSTIAVEASLKDVYSTKISLDRYYTDKGKKKILPKKFWEYIEWGYQVNVLPKHARMFSDAMREIRNILAHADEFNAKEKAKIMIVNMTNIVLEIYQLK